jgi:hypothetical protein
MASFFVVVVEEEENDGDDDGILFIFTAFLPLPKREKKRKTLQKSVLSLSILACDD